MYNQKTLLKWGVTEEEAEKQIQKIRIPKMRLTHTEKEDLYWYIMEGYNNIDDYEALKDIVLFDRETKKEMENDRKEIRKFIKEWRRLERKYNSFDYEDKSLDELTEMWMNDYFELYFMDCHLESIKYYGAKEYAQYYLHIRGVIPSEEVTMWNS